MAKKKGIFDDGGAPAPAGTNGGMIVVDNVGPIIHVEIPLVPGRVTLLTGSNGAGKSETLGAVNALAGLGTDGLSVRDGAEKGRIEGFGAKVNLTIAQKRRTGNFDVLVIEEGFSLARFVRPPHKSAESNDSQRLKDLASFLGVKINLKAVYDLVGGERVYRSIVSEKTARAGDPSEYLKSLKADCDKAALEGEKLAAVIEGEAETLEGTLPEKLEGESDPEVLTRRLTEATNAKAALEARRDNAAESERLAARARELIAAGQGETVAEAEAKHNAAKAEETDSRKLIEELERGLAAERVRLEGFVRRVDDAAKALNAARDRAQEIEDSKAALESSVAKPPSDADFEAAERAIVAAEEAFHLGGKLREAAGIRERIENKRKESREAAESAAALREVAAGVFNLLVEPINKLGCGIEVTNDGRLVVVDHPIRGRCFVEDLSPGEAWTLALKLMVKQNLGESTPAIVAIPQEAFEGLDGANKEAFLKAVAETRLMVITAKASEDRERIPVTAELLEVGSDGETINS